MLRPTGASAALRALGTALTLLAAGPGPAAAQDAGAGITAHEWGVWKLRRGRVTHLAELAAETPRFVSRAAGAPALPLPDDDRPIRVSLKPVLFLYTDAPVDLTVRVRFAGGRPWLYHPPARARGRSLTWRGRLGDPELGALSEPPEGHWWQHLRRVGASPFRSPDGGTERFLFYDGPVRFRPSFRIRRRGGVLSYRPTGDERVLWVVEAGGYRELEVDRRGDPVELGAGATDDLRERLRAELAARGLSPAEATSMLATWDHELFRVTYARALYFVTRRQYDRMLPLRITPSPTELVRVGMVIEELPEP